MLLKNNFTECFKYLLFILIPSFVFGQALAMEKDNQNEFPSAVKFSWEDIYKSDQNGAAKLEWRQASPINVRPAKEDKQSKLNLNPVAILSNPIKRRNKFLNFL